MPAKRNVNLKPTKKLIAAGKIGPGFVKRLGVKRQTKTGKESSQDKKRLAMLPGYRVSKSGKLYRETRQNRSDTPKQRGEVKAYVENRKPKAVKRTPVKMRSDKYKPVGTRSKSSGSTKILLNAAELRKLLNKSEIIEKATTKKGLAYKKSNPENKKKPWMIKVVNSDESTDYIPGTTTDLIKSIKEYLSESPKASVKVYTEIYPDELLGTITAKGITYPKNSKVAAKPSAKTAKKSTKTTAKKTTAKTAKPKKTTAKKSPEKSSATIDFSTIDPDNFYSDLNKKLQKARRSVQLLRVKDGDFLSGKYKVTNQYVNGNTYIGWVEYSAKNNKPHPAKLIQGATDSNGLWRVYKSTKFADVDAFKEAMAKEPGFKKATTPGKETPLSQLSVSKKSPNPAPVKPVGPESYPVIDEKMAEHAKDMSSFSQYEKGSATNEYRETIDDARRKVEAHKRNVDPENHAKIDAMFETYKNRYAKWMNDYNRNKASVPAWFISGPANYPMKKFRRQQSREDSLWKEYNDIEAYLEKILRIGSLEVIRSDDKQAAKKLTTKAEMLSLKQELMKKANAYWRKHQTFDGSDLPAEIIEEGLRNMRAWNGVYNVPFPSYELQNNNANIRRLEKREKEVERNQAIEKTEEKMSWGTIKYNKEINRLQLLFDEIPSPELRDELKHNGFKWSPRYKAWQRLLNRNAEYAVQLMIKNGKLPK